MTKLVPPTLYKNLTETDYLDSFRAYGRVLMRPLSHYRSITDDTKRDDLEGARGVRAHLTESVRKNASELPLPANISIAGTDPRFQPSVVFGAGSKVDIHEASPDVYVFCVSESRFADHPAAYAIVDPNGFGDELARALGRARKAYVSWNLEQVVYGDSKDTVSTQVDFEEAARELERDWNFSDYFRKPSSYSGEREWRYVFFLSDQARVGKAIFIDKKNLVKYCEL